MMRAAVSPSKTVRLTTICVRVCVFSLRLHALVYEGVCQRNHSPSTSLRVRLYLIGVPWRY